MSEQFLVEHIITVLGYKTYEQTDPKPISKGLENDSKGFAFQTNNVENFDVLFTLT